MNTLEIPPSPLAISELSHRVHSDNNDSKETPLVLLHGLMGYASNWGKVWSDLANERPVLIYDQRGHGKSGKPKTGYSPAHYAADLLQLINHYEWDNIHLCGHSMGGRVAIHFAAHHPERVESLILEDSGAFGNPQALAWIENLLNRVPVPFSDRSNAKEFFDYEFRDDPLVGSFLHANIEKKNDGAYGWRFSKDAMLETIEFGRSKDSTDDFKKIQCPTLIIHGELSAHLSKEEVQQMIDLNPHRTTGITISGAGHFVHPVKPNEFNAALKEFIRVNG